MIKHKAIKHLSKRLASSEAFNPTNKDRQAFNVIIEDENIKIEETAVAYSLTIKLLMMVLRSLMIYYDTNINNPIIWKEIRRSLVKPEDHHFQSLTDLSNDLEVERFTDEFKHVKKPSIEEADKLLELLKAVQNSFTKEEIESHIKHAFLDILKDQS